MKTDEIRQKYLDFFASKGHTICASDVLVPKWDPTVLFTPAGMNPFKDHFLGNVELEFTRATSSQKCLRTGDIENVGRTAYHHTFFEMLGNFSFGDYFKREAINWAWEFLTDKQWLNIPKDRLSVTVYLDDDEAVGFWKDDIGLATNQIQRLGEHDNFWPAGAPTDGPDGVCGPCSEIFYHPDNGVECEIWNLVFTQFNRNGNPPNNLSPLPNKNIDTGMGLERIAAVLQGVETNFHIDSLISIVRASSEVCKKKYDPDSEDGRRLRRITDHVRACTMAIHENVLPDAEKENYTVRRLLRRAVFQGRQMGMEEPFLYKIVPAVVAAMAQPYPDLAKTAENVAKVIRQEEETFFNVIERGMRHVDKFVEETKAAGQTQLDAEKVAHFYQTYGVPPELTTSVASEFGMEMDWDKYQQYMDKHAKDSEGESVGVMGNDGPIDMLKQEVKTTPFVGYESTLTMAIVKGCGTTEERLSQIDVAVDDMEGQHFIVLDKTPFYPKSGGQESDAGTIVGPHGEFKIDQLIKTGDMIVHLGRVTRGHIAQDDAVEAIVDSDRRAGLCRAHSATHLLHHALQNHLGSHAQQRGSKVENDELRFDFANDSAVDAEKLTLIEQQSNDHVGQSSDIRADTVALAEAKTAGAMMLFGEKYPDPVRMVSIGDYSKELCGGTHVANTADIEMIEIISEESVSAGIRRVTAYTGTKARENQQTLQTAASQLGKLLGVSVSGLPAAAMALSKEVKGLKKQLTTGVAFEAEPAKGKVESTEAELSYFQVRDVMRQVAQCCSSTVKDVSIRIDAMLGDKMTLLKQIEETKDVAAVSADDLIAEGSKVGNSLMVVKQIDGANADLLKRLVDQIRKKASPAVIVLGSASSDGKVLLVAGVSRDLIDNGVKAGDIVKQIAPIVGGGGGGKPDLAQAGGKQPDKLPEALEMAKTLIQQKLST